MKIKRKKPNVLPSTSGNGIHQRHTKKKSNSKFEDNIFYDGKRGGYYYPLKGGGWNYCDKSSIITRLQGRGFSNKKSKGGNLSPIQKLIIKIQDEQNVFYAGPLAGHMAGPVTESGKRILVTESPKLIEPIKGKWGTIKELFENLFIGEGVDQTPYIYGWLSVGVTAEVDGVV